MAKKKTRRKASSSRAPSKPATRKKSVKKPARKKAPARKKVTKKPARKPAAKTPTRKAPAKKVAPRKSIAPAPNSLTNPATIKLPVAMKKACAKSNSRYAIAGVHVKKCGDAWIAEATDGRVLISMKLEPDAVVNLTHNVIIPATVIVGTKTKPAIITYDGSNFQCGDKIDSAIAGNFPPCDSVWQHELDKYAANRRTTLVNAQFATNVLGVLADVISLSEWDGQCVTISLPENGSKGRAVQILGNNIAALIMPVTDDNGTSQSRNSEFTEYVAGRKKYKAESKKGEPKPPASPKPPAPPRKKKATRKKATGILNRKETKKEADALAKWNDKLGLGLA